MARRGNGEGSIFQRKDGRWAAMISTGGDKRKGYYGKTRADVARRMAVGLKGRQDGLPAMNDRQLVGSFLGSWLAGVRPSLRARTFARYEQYVRIHATPLLGRIPLSRLGPQDLERLYANRLASGSSPATVAHLHAVLHRALGQATRWGLCARNVAGLVTPPRMPRYEMQALTPEQARAVLAAAAGERLEALYIVAITTGMRHGELLGLRWRDIDLDAGAVRVQSSLQRVRGGFELSEPKTAHSRRQVVLGDSAVAALRRWRLRQAEERLAVGSARQDSGLVFTNALGENALGAVRTSFPALLERAGVPRVRFHDLRHSAATLMLGQGIHPKIVSETLGHLTVAITLDLYSHTTPTMQQEAAASMNRLLQAR